jgi:hypothetical protein
MVSRSAHSFDASWRYVLDRLLQLDQNKGTRFLAVVILFTPLIVFTKWFAVIHGTFTYDDLDLLLVARTMPLMQSLLMMHGDVPLPLCRIFFSGMYALFGVNELYWNLFFLFLTLGVQLAALAIVIALGANLVVASLFFLTTISASVWNYTAVGYYSMAIYPQIGLLGLIGVLAIIRWRSGGSANYRWLALGVSAAAPFIHPSGAYVPVVVAVFVFVSQLVKPGASWLPLRMLRPDFRWLTIGLATSIVVFAIFFALEVRSRSFLSMAHSPLSAYAVARSMFFLFSQGMALELFRPLIRLVLRHADPATQGIAAVGLTLVFLATAFWIRAKQRWILLALLVNSLVVVTVVSFGRRLNSIDDVVSSAGKYNNFAYLWFSIAVFYLIACLVPKIPSRWRPTGGAAALAVAGIFFVLYARGENRYAQEAVLRKQQMHDLVATVTDYASKTAPAAMHIPTLDGIFIFPQHLTLFKYNLAHYRPFLQGCDNRLTLLRNTAMDTWGVEGTETVPSLRQATDPAFVHALETDRRLQSLYLDGVELSPLPKAPPGGEPASLDAVKVSNATLLASSVGSLSFSTTGSASVVLFPGDWDPEQVHIFTMRIAATYPIPNPQTKIEVSFEGQLPIPYAANKIVLPEDGGDISIDLLQLYSYALNPRVGKLTLRFPAPGTYTISDVRQAR